MKKFKNVLVVLMSMMIVLTNLATPAVAAEMTSVSKHGQLSVEGTKIVDESGNPVQLHGISTHGINWDCGYPFVNKAAFTEVRDDWGANAIRLAMYTSEYNGYCTGGNQSSLKNLIHEGVTYATELGMYAIIDWHILQDGNPNTYINESKVFFDEISKKYNSYNNVLYEICNEPNGCSWDDIKNYANVIIPIIRKNDPDAIIIVGTPTWSQLGQAGHTNEVADSPLTGYDNIVYALHFYCNEPSHTGYLPAKVDYAINKGLPIIVSEFGLSAANGNDGINTAQAEKWFDKLDSYDIGYFCWSLSNKSETSALIASWCNKSSGWDVSELSAAGQYLRDEYYSRRENLTGAAELPTRPTTEAPTTAPSQVSATGSTTISDSSYWTEKSISMSDLLCGINASEVVGIRFTGNTNFYIGYTSSQTSNFKEVRGTNEYTLTDISFSDYSLKIAIGNNDNVQYTITWEVLTAKTDVDDPTTTQTTQNTTEPTTKEPETETPTSGSSVQFGTNNVTLTGSNWWHEVEISKSQLLGDIEPSIVKEIEFSGNTDFFVGYNNLSGDYNQVNGKNTYTLNDIDLNNFYVAVGISKNDNVNYTINWKVITNTSGSTNEAPTTEAPTTEAPTTEAPTTEAPTTEAPTTEAPTTEAPTTEAPTTEAPTTEAPTTEAPTTEAPTTEAPTTEAPTTEAPTKEAPTTEAPTTAPEDSPVEAFVERLYVNVLDRASEKDGKANWVTALEGGASNGMMIGYGFVFSGECSMRNLSNEDFVEMLYLTFMDRKSDATGKNIWVKQLEAGVDREKIFTEFVGSAEFTQICDDYGIATGSTQDVAGLDAILAEYKNRNANITQFVARCYTEVLGRGFDEGGLNLWCQAIIEKISTPKQVAQNFVNSQEFVMKNYSNEDYVKILYRTFFGREADVAGLELWTATINANVMTKAQTLDFFADSNEFKIILQGFGLN